MPEMIVLGSLRSAFEEASSWRGFAVNAPRGVEPFLEDPRQPRRYEVPGPWGLTPLEAFALHLALGEELPEPANPKEPPDLWISMTYSARLEEGHRLSFQQFVENADGMYVPLPESELHTTGESVFGSSISLRDDCATLLDALGVTGDYESAAAALSDGSDWKEDAEMWRRYRFETLGAIALLRACEKSIELHSGMSFEHEYRDLPEGVVLSSLSSSYFGFGQFEHCEIAEDGKYVVLRFLSGWSYKVPVAFLAWLAKAETLDPEQVLATEIRLDPRFRETLDITLQSGEVIDAYTKNILALCEPSYEEFGEWTGEAAEVVARWNRMHGPFRIHPPPDEFASEEV